MSKKAKRRAALRREQAKRRLSETTPSIREAGSRGPVLIDKAPPAKSEQVADLLEQHKFADARDFCLAWLRTDPLKVEAWNLLTIALHHAGDGGATEAMKQSLLLDPDQPDVLNNLGVLTAEAGDRAQGISLLRQALRLQPRFAKAHCNLANLLKLSNHWDEAAEHYEQGLDIDSQNVETLSSFGALLLDVGETGRAEELLRQAIQLEPTHGSAWVNLCALLNQQHRVKEALAASRKTLELNGSPEAITNLGVALLDNNQVTEGLKWLRTAAERSPALASNYLFAVGQSGQFTDEELFDSHRQWGEQLESRSPVLAAAPRLATGRRLRIGYVSPDFREHVICRYLLPVLERQDRNRFEVFGYAEVPWPDNATRQVQGLCDHWRCTVGSDDLTVAQQIQADQIDVLVDLAGHTRGNRLGVFACRAAPTQVTWMGYPNTTGLSRIDYFLSNEMLNPPELDHCFAERVWRLPRNSACHLAPQSDLSVNELPALANGWITFGSLHRPNKVTDQSLDLWADVLHRVERSRLIMFFPTLEGEFAARFQRELSSRGIASDRFEIRSRASANGYLEQYHEIDIALDVNPWTGGTTIRDACWMGAAPIAWCGERRSARGSSDVLERLQRSDLIAQTPAEYVEIAQRLAGDLDELVCLRRQLRGQVERRLCNAAEFVADFEAAILAMHQQSVDSRGDRS